MNQPGDSGWEVRRCPVPLSPRDQAETIRFLTILRPTLRADEAAAFLDEAAASGYEVALLTEGSDPAPIGCAGFRILPTSRGRILLLEDLVVDGRLRGSGAGTALLEWVQAAAAAAGCVRVELDTARTNDVAQRFYTRHGLRDSALHYSIPVR